MENEIASQAIVNSLYLPSGIDATCLLRYPNISIYEQNPFSHMANAKAKMQLLKESFIDDCLQVFSKGLKLKNFVPPTATEMFYYKHENYSQMILDSLYGR